MFKLIFIGCAIYGGCMVYNYVQNNPDLVHALGNVSKIMTIGTQEAIKGAAALSGEALAELKKSRSEF